MQTFEWIILLLLAAVALAMAARACKAPYPTFLAMGGACLAFIPEGPKLVLDPELALALFVAPVLLDAAFDTSVRDLKDNWLPVTSLALIAVGVTTIAVALVARWLVPEMSWGVAIALGAIVAPPDAAAATAVLRQARLPHRLLKILEGESLFNDASALLVYRLAVTAVLAGSFSIADVAPTFFLGVVGSLVVGPALAVLFSRLIGFVDEAPSAIIVQFATTFGVWILAEQVGLSGILTVVAYGITVARWAPLRTPARLRVPAYAVWETAVFVLNAFAFVLIGLQIGPILQRLEPAERTTYLVFAAAVLATVILARIGWVMTYNTAVRFKIARWGFRPSRPLMRPTVRSGLIVSWAGMRGIVTLAAAFALPEMLPDGSAFPHRDLVVLAAFAVVLGTLVLQGLTLRPLILALGLDDGDPVGEEVRLARGEAYRAALQAIDGDESLAARILRKEYTLFTDEAEDAEGPHANRLRIRAIAAARDRMQRLRADGTIGDDAYHRLEEEFDWAELRASNPSAL